MPFRYVLDSRGQPIFPEVSGLAIYLEVKC